MSNVAFSLMGQPIYWYGIIIAFGVLMGTLVASSHEKRMHLTKDTAIDFVLVCVPVAVICARIYYVAFQWDAFKDDLISVFYIRSGGLAIYGGVIGGALAALFIRKWKKVSYGSLADMAAPALVLGQAIGRWGNFANQEAYGYVVSNPVWQFFPVSVYIEADAQWHLATFFYESAWCFFVFAILEVLTRRGYFDNKKKGDVFWWYVLLYCAERSVVEGLRTDSLYWGSVRVSQALSCAMMLLAAVVFFVRIGKKKSGSYVLLGAALAGGAFAAGLAMGILPYSTLGMLAGVTVCALAAVMLHRENGVDRSCLS